MNKTGRYVININLEEFIEKDLKHFVKADIEKYFNPQPEPRQAISVSITLKYNSKCLYYKEEFNVPLYVLDCLFYRLNSLGLSVELDSIVFIFYIKDVLNEEYLEFIASIQDSITTLKTSYLKTNVFLDIENITFTSNPLENVYLNLFSSIDFNNCHFNTNLNNSFNRSFRLFHNDLSDINFDTCTFELSDNTIKFALPIPYLYFYSCVFISNNRSNKIETDESLYNLKFQVSYKLTRKVSLIKCSYLYGDLSTTSNKRGYIDLQILSKTIDTIRLEETSIANLKFLPFIASDLVSDRVCIRDGDLAFVKEVVKLKRGISFESITIERGDLQEVVDILCQYIKASSLVFKVQQGLYKLPVLHQEVKELVMISEDLNLSFIGEAVLKSYGSLNRLTLMVTSNTSLLAFKDLVIRGKLNLTILPLSVNKGRLRNRITIGLRSDISNDLIERCNQLLEHILNPLDKLDLKYLVKFEYVEIWVNCFKNYRASYISFLILFIEIKGFYTFVEGLISNNYYQLIDEADEQNERATDSPQGLYRLKAPNLCKALFNEGRFRLDLESVWYLLLKCPSTKNTHILFIPLAIAISESYADAINWVNRGIDINSLISES